MAHKEPLPVQPAVLAWARESAAVPLEAAAKAAGVKAERIEGWERGDDTPTIPQLRKLAEKYKRPLAVLLLPEPPRNFMPLRDCRRVDLTTGVQPAMPPRVAYETRLAQERREIALDMLSEMGEAARPFPLKATIADDPEVVGLRIRELLDVKPEDVRRWIKKGEVFEGWRALIEAQDVLVFVMGGSTAPRVRDVRGFAIPAKELPIIAVNGKDRTNGRTFTLMHELAHVLLGEGVVENAVAPGPGMPPPVRRTERWCNAVAAAVLMPAQTVAHLVADKGPTSDWTSAELEKAAQQMGVSREAALLRFVNLGKASRRGYVTWREAFEEEYDELDKPLGKNTPIPPHKLKVRQYGRSYARLVIAGYRNRKITLNDAAAFLGVQAVHVPYIETQAFKTA